MIHVNLIPSLMPIHDILWPCNTGTKIIVEKVFFVFSGISDCEVVLLGHFYTTFNFSFVII